MKSKLCLLLAVLGYTLAASGLGAQQGTPPIETARFGIPTSTARIFQNYIYGVVKKVSKTELVLGKTIQGVDQTYKIERKTKFIQDGKTASLKNIKVGEDVFVETKKDKKTGDVIAIKIVTGVAATQLP